MVNRVGHRILHQRRLLIGLVLVSAGLLISGVVAAIAAIPAADGTIYGCYLTQQNDLERQGNLRVVSNPSLCKDTETPIFWNQVGPQGPMGPPGPAASSDVLCDLERRINAAIPEFLLRLNCSHIAFMSNRAGNYDVFTMNSDGTNVKQLTANSVDEGSPAFSPDGRKITYERESAIWIMNADGTGQQKLTSLNTAAIGPADWSPDGKKLVFAAGGPGNWQLYTMNGDGTGVIGPLTSGNQVGAPR